MLLFIYIYILTALDHHSCVVQKQCSTLRIHEDYDRVHHVACIGDDKTGGKPTVFVKTGQTGLAQIGFSDIFKSGQM
jgi:hypothetical protein